MRKLAYNNIEFGQEIPGVRDYLRTFLKLEI